MVLTESLVKRPALPEQPAIRLALRGVRCEPNGLRLTTLYGIWNMEWNIGYETSVMSQELHFYHKAVTVLDLYHSHLNLYTKSAFV